MFVLENRVANVLQAIGFSRLDELEEAVDENPSVWKLDSIIKNAQKAGQSVASLLEEQSTDRQGASITRNEFEELKRQVDLLRLPLGVSRKAK